MMPKKDVLIYLNRRLEQKYNTNYQRFHGAFFKQLNHLIILDKIKL